jgi:predicted MPP superfamily phosphohydrolase
VFDRLTAGPTPDVVILGGDYLDSDAHRAWIAPLFGRLKWNEAGFAVVGNHDEHHDPDKTRAELVAAGFRVLSNRWETATIRGVKCVVVGHEGPWFGPPPDLKDAPADGFRLCVSHTPDNFYWGQANRINLMLCGHVHGGQVRFPVVGPIFVPSKFGRRFDGGVYEGGGTVMVAARGLSGKEPLRFRCNPQVVRLTLARTPARG